MSIWDLIPTCDDPMSIYTLCGLTLIVSAGLLAFTIFFRWTSNEFRRNDKRYEDLEASISRHDDYIDNANEIINKIHIDLAVQESVSKDIKRDIEEIKALIASINKTLLDKLT